MRPAASAQRRQKLRITSISLASIASVSPGYVPRNSVVFMISSEPSISPTTRIASGRSWPSYTKAGCRSRLPPKSIRLSVWWRSSSWARSVRLKGEACFTAVLKPSQEPKPRVSMADYRTPSWACSLRRSVSQGRLCASKNCRSRRRCSRPIDAFQKKQLKNY
jgi:hypothetical protein